MPATQEQNDLSRETDVSFLNNSKIVWHIMFLSLQQNHIPHQGLHDTFNMETITSWALVLINAGVFSEREEKNTILHAKDILITNANT